MPKEKNYNPVQAQRKADKAKAIKKGSYQCRKCVSYQKTDRRYQERPKCKNGAMRDWLARTPTEFNNKSMN